MSNGFSLSTQRGEKMKKALFALCVLGSSAAVGMSATPAQAALLSVSQGGQIIGAPASVGDNDNESFLMTGFDEKQNVLLTEDLQVDGGFIKAGEVVSSHLIFLNQPRTASGALTVSDVKWLFDGTILGVMSDSPGNLEAQSNALLGAPGTVYPGSFPARGMESNDSYSGVGTNTLNVTMAVSQPGDWIRVVTKKDVPEPASILGLLAIASLSTICIRKQKQLG